MHYPVGYNRSLMIVLLVTYFIQVGSATPLEKREFFDTEPGPPPPGTSSTPPFRLLEAAQRAAAALVRDTARVSDKVLWSFGKMLLSAGESVNYVWDAALNATVQLLKAGGAACGSVAERLAHVPVIGFGVSGVHEVVGVAVNAVASDVAHSSLVRSQALAALNAKLNESGARLRPAAGETGAPAQATTATYQQGPFDRCSSDDAVPPISDGAEVADKTAATADSAAAKTDPTTATTDPANDPATATTDQPSPADDGKASTFSKCKVELYKSISTIGRGAGLFLKGFGQAALSVLGALFGAFNGLLSITATTQDTVATGVNLVNNAAGSIALVRDVTGGAASLATGLATTNRLNSEFIIENRDKLFDSLDKSLDNYHPESEKFLVAPATGQDVAAPPTNGGAQATTAEAAPETPAPVQP